MLQYRANKCFLKSAEAVSGDTRISQIVRQWVPGRRARNTESPSAVRLQPWRKSTGSHRLVDLRCCREATSETAEVEQVLRRLTLQATVHHDAELVHDSLRHIEPVQFGVQYQWQSSAELVCAGDHTSCSIHHSLKLVSRHFWRTRQKSFAVVDAWRHE